MQGFLDSLEGIFSTVVVDSLSAVIFFDLAFWTTTPSSCPSWWCG